MFLWTVLSLFVTFGFNKIVAVMNDSQLRDHVNLASDIKNYYRASSVFNVYNDKNAGNLATFLNLA